MTAIPITLTPVPVPVGVSYSSINQLLTIISQYVAGQIQANVTFIQEFANDPSTFQGNLIFNTTEGLWKRWDLGTTSYQPLTAFTYGDTKNTFVSGDDTTNGWIVCDGRKISAIQNITATQAAVLQSLFGVNGSLPVVNPLQALSGLPQNNAFADISNPAVQPPANQIGSLPFSNPPAQTEVQALATNTENLDASVITLQAAVASIITNSEAVLDSLNGSQATKFYAKVYCGPGD